MLCWPLQGQLMCSVFHGQLLLLSFLVCSHQSRHQKDRRPPYPQALHACCCEQLPGWSGQGGSLGEGPTDFQWLEAPQDSLTSYVATWQLSPCSSTRHHLFLSASFYHRQKFSRVFVRESIESAWFHRHGRGGGGVRVHYTWTTKAETLIVQP